MQNKEELITNILNELRVPVTQKEVMERYLDKLSVRNLEHLHNAIIDEIEWTKEEAISTASSAIR